MATNLTYSPTRSTIDFMTDYASLLLAVLESPDDDLPRLVLAGWLKVNGES